MKSTVGAVSSAFAPLPRYAASSATSSVVGDASCRATAVISGVRTSPLLSKKATPTVMNIAMHTRDTDTLMIRL